MTKYREFSRFVRKSTPPALTLSRGHTRLSIHSLPPLPSISAFIYPIERDRREMDNGDKKRRITNKFRDGPSSARSFFSRQTLASPSLCIKTRHIHVSIDHPSLPPSFLMEEAESFYTYTYTFTLKEGGFVSKNIYFSMTDWSGEGFK